MYRDEPKPTYGHTQVLGCCTFEWTEHQGARVVHLPATYHAACLEELEHVAQLLGVRLEITRDDVTAA